MEKSNEEFVRENRILRQQIKEMGDMIAAIRTLLNIYDREGSAIASAEDPMAKCEEVYNKFPTGVEWWRE